ncbi:hypothetical protein MY3296_004711 [Beauveria thailandica]
MGPPELILRIFEHCSCLQDAWALALTCRHISDVWRASNAGARIVWRFWLRDLPCADEALIAARAAQLVLDAEERDELPPKTMKLHELSSRKSLPSTSELNAVWDLQRLARSIECVLLSDDLILPKDMQGKHPDRAPEDPDRMLEWRKGVWIAIYRSLISGAALAAAYQEPLFEGKKTNIPELQSLADAATFSETQLSFINKFTVFQTVTSLEQETPVFAPLGQWLLKSILSESDARHAMAQRFEMRYGRSTTCPGQGPNASDCPLRPAFHGSHSDAHLVVWELIKMFWMQERLSWIVGTDYDLTEDNAITPNGKAPIVLFGYFAAMKVKGPCLSASPPTDSPLEDGSGSLNSLLHRLHEDSGQPNRYEQGLEVAPLHAKFFEYFLRRYFGVRFHRGFFDYEEEAGNRDSTHSSFTQTLTLFSHDDIKGRSASCFADAMPYVDFMSGSEILEPANDPVDRWSTSA